MYVLSKDWIFPFPSVSLRVDFQDGLPRFRYTPLRSGLRGKLDDGRSVPCSDIFQGVCRNDDVRLLQCNENVFVKMRVVPRRHASRVPLLFNGLQKWVPNASVLNRVMMRSSGAEGVNESKYGVSWTVQKKTRNPEKVRSISTTTTTEAPVLTNAEIGDAEQKVVIVGAGIAGLAAAVALQRVGIKALVLERASAIRASGAAVSIWGNAWRALEVLGTAEGLRETYIASTRINLYSQTGNVLASFALSDYPGGPHELRTVPRKVLVETLASQLPAGTIQVNSSVKAIHRQPRERCTKVELENGSVISTKVLVGCDGWNSVVGKWMGIPPAQYGGAVSVMGIAEYPDGHNFASAFCHYTGGSTRVGFIPVTPTSVYWFVGIRKVSPGPKVTDPTVIRQEAFQALSEGFPDVTHSFVNHTHKNLARVAPYYRLNIPGISPPLVKDGVAVAGDAFHPMMPSLGQGACVALEDGVILARMLGDALSLPKNEEGAEEAIHKALEDYTAERQRRSFPITFKAFLLGLLFAKRAGRAKQVIDNFILPKFAPRIYMGHTLYKVGKLPGPHFM